MRGYLSAISRDLSRFLLVPTGMALLSLPVCMIGQEWFAVVPFGLTALVTLVLSYLLHCHGRSAQSSNLRRTVMSVALGWALIATLGALPFWLVALSLGSDAPPTVANFSNGLNALFEAFSGFTSAGLTMALNPSELPLSLQWWRSFMQWVGGVGVIVLAIALLEPAHSDYELYQAEGRQSRLRLTVTQTVRRIWLIYLGYTVVSLLLLRSLGMSWWAALNHGMTAISTGGFTITDNSIGAYDAPVKLAVIAVMICGAIAFGTHYQMLQQRNPSVLWHDHQHRLLILFLLLGIVLVGLEYAADNGSFAWVDSAFQWASALTTCGFSTQTLQNWSSSNKLMLSLGMIIGGAAGSTVGGLKLKRILVLSKATIWHFQQTKISPHQLLAHRINDRLFTPNQAYQQVADATVLAILWIVCIGLGVIVLLHLVPDQYSLSDVIFETASALGSSGLSTGIAGPSLHWLGKCLLILLMWMGRLEIVPVLMLLSAPWKQVFQYLRK